MTAKTGALVLGVIFVLVGIAGFVPNPLVGPTGIFVTNPMHDYIHIGSGAVLVIAGLTSFAKPGLLLIGGSVYCLAAPAGSTLAGLPAELWSIALAAAAIFLVLLVTLGAWLRPLESVEQAVEILGVPLVALEKGGTPDVR